MKRKKPGKQGPRKKREASYLSGLSRQSARDLLNDEMILRMLAGVERIEPGRLLADVMAKYPDLTVNKSLLHYLKKK